MVFGDKVTGRSPEMVAAHGVALVPQGRRIFKSLTVRENLMVAARKPDAGSKHAPWTAETVFAMFPAPRRTAQADRRRIYPAASSRCWRSAVR